ncbi:MAG: phosphoglycerate dehydrogenase [Defluviitaleaceae bacterium]|nr:phosphoglycerate dehydrogenase [Defluviitaleaceae bacterium]
MKVLVTPRSFGKTDPSVFDVLKNAGLEIVCNNSGGILSEEQISDLVSDCHGVILGVDPFTKKVIDNAPHLKAIAKYGVGVDNIDLDACKARDITVSRTVGANANAVADYAFALVLAVARKVIPIDIGCRKLDWGKSTSIDVFGKTMGLIGLGAIAKGVAARAKGFGMKVLSHDVFWDNDYATKEGIEKADLPRIYKEADFISLHVPLTEETRNMIGEAEIATMKPTTVIINTARGGIINEDALLKALQSNKIYGAGLDAFEQEPPTNTAWFSLDNVVIGSHCAASTVGATEQMGRMAAENIIRDLKNQ